MKHEQSYRRQTNLSLHFTWIMQSAIACMSTAQLVYRCCVTLSWRRRIMYLVKSRLPVQCRFWVTWMPRRTPVQIMIRSCCMCRQSEVRMSPQHGRDLPTRIRVTFASVQSRCCIIPRHTLHGTSGHIDERAEQSIVNQTGSHNMADWRSQVRSRFPTPKQC